MANVARYKRSKKTLWYFKIKNPQKYGDKKKRNIRKNYYLDDDIFEIFFTSISVPEKKPLSTSPEIWIKSSG